MPVVRKVRKRTTKKKTTKPKLKEPVWKGPEDDSERGGITQSLLSQWLCCRERFRLRVIDGLATEDKFNHSLEYGNMWHICEEALAASCNPIVSNPVAAPPWERALKNYAFELSRKYRFQQEQVSHWYNVCKTQFPIYVDYWSKHPDVKNRTPLYQEEVFHEPLTLPSGKVVWLKGMFDSVDKVGKGKSAGIYLQENKSKGQIKEPQIKRQLNFDLQTMIYLIALESKLKREGVKTPVLGIRYNVIRRPLSGGKGSIRKHKPTKSNPTGETDDQFYARLGCLIKDDPSDYFMRWKVEVASVDLKKFKHEFLYGALEELCDWWSWVSSTEGRIDPFIEPIHYRLPYGIYNVIAEGGSTDIDEYLATGSETGLIKNKPLFGELQ